MCTYNTPKTEFTTVTTNITAALGLIFHLLHVTDAFPSSSTTVYEWSAGTAVSSIAVKERLVRCGQRLFSPQFLTLRSFTG